MSQKQYFYQKLLWDTYTALVELNTTFPSRLFPLPLAVERDRNSNLPTFAFEYPLTPSAVTSLETKIRGKTPLIPLRAVVYSHHESSKRVLAHALRHYPDVAEFWCSQFGQAYRVLQQYSNIQYHFDTAKQDTLTSDSSGGNGDISELINADIFVREDGSLVLGNAMVTVDEEVSSGHITKSRNTDAFVKVATSLLCECLTISRAITVRLNPSDPDIEASPEYLHKIDQELQSNTYSENRALEEDNMEFAPRESTVYIAEGCGLDIFPHLNNISRDALSESSIFILFIEDNDTFSDHRMNRSTSGKSIISGHTRSNASLNGTKKCSLDKLLRSEANVLVKMTSTDTKIVSLEDVNGDDMSHSKTTIDGNKNSTITFPGLNSMSMAMRARKGLSFRVKAKTPGIAYIHIFHRAKSNANGGVGDANRIVFSITLKLCVVAYPTSKSTQLCEVISLSESSFWTPLHRPISNMQVFDNSSSRKKGGESMNCALFLDQVFSAQCFKRRVRVILCLFINSSQNPILCLTFHLLVG